MANNVVKLQKEACSVDIMNDFVQFLKKYSKKFWMWLDGKEKASQRKHHEHLTDFELEQIISGNSEKTYTNHLEICPDCRYRLELKRQVKENLLDNYRNSKRL